MKILEQLDDNLTIKFNDSVHLNSILKVLMSHYTKLLDKDQLVPMTLPQMNDCSVIWIEKNNNVIGGICCKKNDEHSSLNIESIFYQNFLEFKDLYLYCHKHCEIYAKNEGYGYISISFDIDNNEYKELIDNVGMTKRFYISSRKL
jgi:hypothetical protein